MQAELRLDVSAVRVIATGSVSIALPAAVSADIDIETGSGGSTTDFSVRTTRVQRNRLRGTIGDGPGRFKLETGSGSVRLRKHVN